MCWLYTLWMRWNLYHIKASLWTLSQYSEKLVLKLNQKIYFALRSVLASKWEVREAADKRQDRQQNKRLSHVHRNLIMCKWVKWTNYFAVFHFSSLIPFSALASTATGKDLIDGKFVHLKLICFGSCAYIRACIRSRVLATQVAFSSKQFIFQTRFTAKAHTQEN